jgi:hypothetical protein
MKRTLLLLALIAVAALPVAAQGRGPKKEFVVAPNRAVIAARDVLVSRGFEVIRMEVRGNDRVLFYRRGNMGRGKGQGPPMTLIIRQMRDKVVFVDTPDAVLVDINVRLKL